MDDDSKSQDEIKKVECAPFRTTRTVVYNDHRVNELMVNEGKNRIAHLKQLSTISPQVMDKLNQVIQPLDEKAAYKQHLELLRKIEV